MKLKVNLVIFVLITFFSTSYPQDYEAIIRSFNENNIKNFKKEVRALDDPDSILINGYTLLHYAIYQQRLKFVKYLVRRDVDIEKDVQGVTPLMFSVYYDLEIMQYLLSRGVDVNRNVNGNSALMVAIRAGNKVAAMILENHGAKISLIGGPDGPHIFDHNDDTTIVVTVTMSNQLKIDTFNNHHHEVYIRTPANDSFMFSLNEPAVELESVFEDPGKIFVISDIEGNFVDFVTILKNNGIVDNRLNWSFGDGHLVLLGDFVDRGEYVTQVLWLIYKLEKEAIANGGKVHYLLGNHELMAMQGNTRYVRDKYHILAYLIGKEVQDFYSNSTFLGRWMGTKNVIEKIGNYIFVHGGISDSIMNAGLSIQRINEIARLAYRLPQLYWKEETRLVMETYGVLWYRGFITDYLDYKKMTQASLDKILDYYDATNIFIGHCIVEDISTDYEGKVIRINVNHYISTSSGVLIEDGNIYKVQKTGEKALIDLPDSPDEL
ncbi:MAG: ankyrin repeat domain-containing protein [Bacteroidales bacterium]|nr:ankyrin repeat domain-containing protein [Bacteroidales bacterium]